MRREHGAGAVAETEDSHDPSFNVTSIEESARGKGGQEIEAKRRETSRAKSKSQAKGNRTTRYHMKNRRKRRERTKCPPTHKNSSIPPAFPCPALTACNKKPTTCPPPRAQSLSHVIPSPHVLQGLFQGGRPERNRTPPGAALPVQKVGRRNNNDGGINKNLDRTGVSVASPTPLG
ncbi:hypothetical protein N658DRAFT_51148 [Parathielavia hyrcaniae]|uniref:Uncharacterized protein n=1 Tax=Parathielavia hyrcaniae TaxID=113614 RepID=A0AAN6Q195_9PEZI|nr:hypothetical protein N658DRAFT_51148 [Parathielavia hyrcaniae]